MMNTSPQSTPNESVPCVWVKMKPNRYNKRKVYYGSFNSEDDLSGKVVMIEKEARESGPFKGDHKLVMVMGQSLTWKNVMIEPEDFEFLKPVNNGKEE